MNLKEWKKLEGFVELKITEEFDGRRLILIKKDQREYCIGSLEPEEKTIKACSSCKFNNEIFSEKVCTGCFDYKRWEEICED